MNPFETTKSTKDGYTLKGMTLRPCKKDELHPYSRTRMILMNGTEFEGINLLHRFSRCCPNNEVRRVLAELRRSAQVRQKRLASLKPEDESILEHTIGYEQLAVDLTAILAKNEPNSYVKRQLDFALLEDFDHLYRYADLMELEGGGDPARMVGSYTEIMPGRPTVAEHRHPHDDVKFYINSYLNDIRTRLNATIITAAEQQTMNYYMNVGNFYASPLGRRLYSEIAMIEEQHVTGYGCLLDPCMTNFERVVMHLYTAGYLYLSCVKDEVDTRLAEMYEAHCQSVLSDLGKACVLLEKYEGKVWQQLFPDGADYPALLNFCSQKDYVREVLKTVRLTAVGEGFEELDAVPNDFAFFAFNRHVTSPIESVASHQVIVEKIRADGEDYRLQEGEHPVEKLRVRESDNVSVGREKGE